MPEVLVEQAPAKVNLYLHVTGRRRDGYHLLDSLVVFAGVADLVSAGPADSLSLRVVGPFAAGLAAEPNNLVLRAACALAAAYGRPPRAHLMLRKTLPVASGIGGGSADAAATLRALCRLWGLEAEEDHLARLALELGADVPACLVSRPCRMQGIGEALSPGPSLPRGGMVLVNPGVAVSTAEVFRSRQGGWSPCADLPPAWSDVETMATDLASLRNDLQSAAVGLRPEIGAVLSALAATSGCLLARMSGSGATCFGLFADADAAASAVRSIQWPGWWCWSGPLRCD